MNLVHLPQIISPMSEPEGKILWGKELIDFVNTIFPVDLIIFRPWGRIVEAKGRKVM